MVPISIPMAVIVLLHVCRLTGNKFVPHTFICMRFVLADIADTVIPHFDPVRRIGINPSFAKNSRSHRPPPCDAYLLAFGNRDGKTVYVYSFAPISPLPVFTRISHAYVCYGIARYGWRHGENMRSVDGIDARRFCPLDASNRCFDNRIRNRQHTIETKCIDNCV